MKDRHILFSSRRMQLESAEIIFKSDPKPFFKNIARRRDVDSNGYIYIVSHTTSQTVQIEHNGIAVQIDWRRLPNIIKNYIKAAFLFIPCLIFDTKLNKLFL